MASCTTPGLASTAGSSKAAKITRPLLSGLTSPGPTGATVGAGSGSVGTGSGAGVSGAGAWVGAAVGGGLVAGGSAPQAVSSRGSTRQAARDRYRMRFVSILFLLDIGSDV